MYRYVAAFVLSGCLGLHLWAQPPQNTRGAQAPASDQKQADEISPTQEPTSGNPGAGIETTDFPLDKFREFSAIVSGSMVPRMDTDRHIYRSGDIFREEGEAKGGKYYLTDLESKETRVFSRLGCLRISASSPHSFPFTLTGPGFKYEIVPQGDAVVDGHQCRVEDIRVHRPKRVPLVLSFRVYEAQDLQGFPVEIENRREGGYHWVIHYKNVVLGRPDTSLFVIPDQCDSMKGFQRGGPAPKAKINAPAPPKPQ